VDGKLLCGHKKFEWLQAVLTAVMAAHKTLPPGDFLWELIYPRDAKDNSYIKPANGKYRIRLFIMVRQTALEQHSPVPTQCHVQVCCFTSCGVIGD
jgi:hypothetical protein